MFIIQHLTTADIPSLYHPLPHIAMRHHSSLARKAPARTTRVATSLMSRTFTSAITVPTSTVFTRFRSYVVTPMRRCSVALVAGAEVRALVLSPLRSRTASTDTYSGSDVALLGAMHVVTVCQEHSLRALWKQRRRRPQRVHECHVVPAGEAREAQRRKLDRADDVKRQFSGLLSSYPKVHMQARTVNRASIAPESTTTSLTTPFALFHRIPELTQRGNGLTFS